MPGRFGWAGPGLPDRRDHLYAADPRVVAALPARVDLIVPPLGEPFDPAFNQEDIGSCGPNSAAANLLLIMERATGSALVPSRLFIYYATRQLMGTTEYDSGVYNRDLLKALNKFGWCSEENWPYVVSRFKTKPVPTAWADGAMRKISEYLSVPQTLNQMKGCLAEGYPIIFGFSVYESFMGGVTEATGTVQLPEANEKVIGGHDVLIVGYNDDAQRFKFRNSWGEWGAEGNGTIPYAYALSPNMAGDFWTVRRAGWSPPAPPVPTNVRIQVPQAGTYQLVPASTLTAETAVAVPEPEPAAVSHRRVRRES